MSTRREQGFTILELGISMVIVAMLIGIAMVAYNNYEVRTRCFGAAQVLSMDMRLQQQRARTMDEPQGIRFDSRSSYSLGGGDRLAVFKESFPARRVDLSQTFHGVYVESITHTVNGSLSIPAYIYFDPSTGQPGSAWVPFSGFTGTIVMQGRERKSTITVTPGGEITVDIK